MQELGTEDTMADSDAGAVRDMLQAFRRRHLDPVWDQLNRIDDARYAALWQALGETGLTLSSLPEADGGVPLDNAARCAALAELGAAVPALGVALISHLTAQQQVLDAAGGRWPADRLPADASCALLASPLDPEPESAFSLSLTSTTLTLSGCRRVMRPNADWLVIPAHRDGRLYLCVLRADTPGLSFLPNPSSHGLCLLPFGELSADRVTLDGALVFDWPDNGHAANTADALTTALIAGMVDELALRAMDYARQRYQAGKMISEHHAVQQLLGPIEIARRPLHALALSALSQPRRGDGSAAAFAIPIARRAALDAVQTFGGYGYMQDYRVERYLRDANTLETFWIHAAQRERDAAARRCHAMDQGAAA